MNHRALKTLALLILSATAPAAPLSLQAYLAQVGEGNHALAQARSTAQGMELVPEEAKAAFSPWVSAQYAKLDDQTRALAANPSTMQPMALDQHLWSQDLSAAWRQRLPLGTGVLMEYKLNRSVLEYPGLMPATDPIWRSSYGVTLSQPLLKDAWGRAWAQVERAQASARSAKALSLFAARAKQVEAEASYWQLVVARQSVVLAEEGLGRSRRLKAFGARKARFGMQEEVDRLSFEAAEAGAALALEQAQQGLASAALNFNALRGREGGQVEEELEALTAPQGGLKRDAERLDVASARYDLESAEAQVTEVSNRYTPDLSLFGSWGRSGLGSDREQMVEAQMKSDLNRSLMWGVKLDMTLDLPMWLRVRKGAALGRGAVASALAEKRLQAEREWRDLEREWQSVQKRLELARRMESLNRERAALEKARYAKGRTSTYQVLQAEGDYSQARLALLGLSAQARALQARARMWGE